MPVPERPAVEGFIGPFRRQAGDDAARRARDDYGAAYAIDRHPYPGINVATLSRLLGLPGPTVRSFASDVVERLDARTGAPTSWDEATRGEALLLLATSTARSAATNAP